MSNNILRLIKKAYKFTVSRSLQRFNVENRAVKYLGPESKKFVHSPRAIGQISGLSLKELPKYPQLQPGYKSISQRRREALARGESSEDVPRLKRSYSEDKEDDRLVLEASSKIDVIKTIASLAPPVARQRIESGETKANQDSSSSSLSTAIHRPLPTSTNLQLQDQRNIWEVKQTPPGRLNLNMLQELMLNKVADDDHWTPAAIAERYNIREEYAEKLVTHLKQIRVRVSPRMAKNLEYVGRNNPEFMAAKHIIFYVDKSLRTELDKKFDSMYLPSDDLPDEVSSIIDTPSFAPVEQKHWVYEVQPKNIRRIARPKPLRIAPRNDPSQREQYQPPHIEPPEEDGAKRLEAPRDHKRFTSMD